MAEGGSVISIGSRRLRLMQGDLTELDVDAIVNAANSALRHGGGVAAAIARKGGPAIQRESDAIGHCPVGQAVMTGGGRLRARHVIHAVGPRQGDGQEEVLLRSAVRCALELAGRSGLRSIAFPAISTGIYAVPVPAAASALLAESLAYLHEADSSIEEIVFCLFSAEDLAVFERELARQAPRAAHAMDEALLAQLDDPDPDERGRARARLVRLGAEAYPALLTAFERCTEPGRREAAQGLAEIGATQAVPRLIAALDDPEDPALSAVAVALGKLKDRRATPALVARLGDEALRNSAAAGLGELGDAAAVEPLRESLRQLIDRYDYGSYLGRFWLASALAQLGDRSDTTVEALREVIERDFGFDMQQSWGSFRDAAVDWLIELEPGACADFLPALLRRERETLALRFHVARCLWKRGERPSEARQVIEKTARHPGYPGLAAEARALLESDGPEDLGASGGSC